VTLTLQAGQTPVRPAFSTPQEAIQATIAASEKNDTAALLQLFGPGSKGIVESGDAAEDKQDRAQFARLAREKFVVNQDSMNPNFVTFSIGNQASWFPIPLVHKNGKWEFDATKGRVEILAHRIGENELNAVEVSRGYVEAQLEYASKDRDGDGILQYAQRIVSSPGKKDGLYWEGGGDLLVPKAFAGAAVAVAANPSQTGKPLAYHGYHFRILTAQGAEAPGGPMNYIIKGNMIGGFAMVAWPAEYGVSGVKTFIVSAHGVVYEKDLGANTVTLAQQMARFNPDKSWHRVDFE
jgi:hypothetical protein